MEPGRAPTIPVPNAIEQAVLGGVSWTTHLFGRPDVVLLIEPGFLGVEGLRTVHLGNGTQD